MITTPNMGYRELARFFTWLGLMAHAARVGGKTGRNIERIAESL